MANVKSSFGVGTLALALMSGPLAAQQLISTGGSFAEVRLLPGGPISEGVRTIGLEMTMKPGWKTYWRSPGEAGVPPRFDWAGSENLLEAQVLWPVPERFESFGYETLGYEGRVVLPVRLAAADPGAPIVVSLDLEFGVCAEICVFELAEFDVVLSPAADEGAPAVAAAVASVPAVGSDAGVEQALCRIEGNGTERMVHATIRMVDPRPAPHVIVEASGEAWAHGVTAEAVDRLLKVEAALSLATPDVWVSRSDLRFTLIGEDGFAADIPGCVGSGG